jgi:hypothetical protein
MAAAEPEQDQDDERVLEEIVVERGKELAPEQRREAPSGHEVGGHGVDSGARGISTRCLY